MKLPDEIEVYRQEVEQGLTTYFKQCQGPAKLIEAMGYSLFAGGKRLRPILLMAAQDVFRKDKSDLPDALPAACALEYIHTYSLIHDDLPCMDDDDLRRGKPTSHKQFSEALAILAGDALLTQAFALLASAYAFDPGLSVKLISEIAQAAGSQGMVGGQVLDIENLATDLDQNRLREIHSLKTGALLTSCLRCGAHLGFASQQEMDALTRFGQQIGLAFQVADDVLDVIGTNKALGKTAGKDQQQGKNTYASILGVEQATRYVGQLVAQAKQELAVWKQESNTLCALADFIEARVGQTR